MCMLYMYNENVNYDIVQNDICTTNLCIHES